MDWESKKVTDADCIHQDQLRKIFTGSVTETKNGLKLGWA